MSTGSAGATAAVLPHSALALQSNADLTFTARALDGRWQVGGEIVGGATTVTGGDRTGALAVVGELVRRGPEWGIAAGGGTAAGWIVGTVGAAGARARLRAWWQAPGVRLTGSVESTRLLGAWYSDFTAGASLHRGPLDLTVTAMARASRGWGSSAAGSAVADLTLSPRVGVEVAGGSALADLYQGFPRTGFFSAGVRLFLPPRPARSVVQEMRIALAHSDANGVVTVTFQLTGDSVTIAGDWNDWTPEALTQVAPGVWQLSRPLAPGVYRFGLSMGGRGWIVPPGVPTVPDDWGGRVAVLVVQ